MRNLIITSILSLETGCLIPGGSDDTSPIEHYELDHGTWCTDANPVQTCLSVDHYDSDPPSVSHYLLEQGQCYEHGLLSGGLEFSPSQPSSVPCLAAIPEYADLYSAAGEWTSTGIRLAVNYSDGTAEGTSETTVLEMHYVP